MSFVNQRDRAHAVYVSTMKKHILLFARNKSATFYWYELGRDVD